MKKHVFAILSVIAICAPSLLQGQHTPQTPAEEYRSMRSGIRPIVVTTLLEFTKAIQRRVGSRPFAVYEYLGFSGAGYSDIEFYKRHFKLRALFAQKETKDKFGDNAVTVFLLGGTTDGFGAGYDVLQTLRDPKVLKDDDDVIVAGLVSDAAVDSHKEYGGVISPNQDVLLLMDVYKAPGQKESWELLSEKGGRSATVQVLLDLAGKSNAKQVTMELFEGGKQAVKEAQEYLMEGARSRKTRLVLHPGYEPKKLEKAGKIRAATDVGVFVRGLAKKHTQTFFTSRGGAKLIPAAQYYKSRQGQLLN